MHPLAFDGGVLGVLGTLGLLVFGIACWNGMK